MRSSLVVATIATIAASSIGCDTIFGAPPLLADAFVCDKAEPDDTDEDGDCIADDIDNCPGVANLDQRDDGERARDLAADGVGDACDPDPANAGDALVQFEGFDDPATAATAWRDTDFPAHWRFATGNVVHDDATVTGSYLQRFDAVPDSAELLAEVAFEFHAWGTVDKFPSVALVVDDIASPPSKGLYCKIVADRAGGRRDELVLGDNADGATVSNIPLLTGTHAIRMRIHRRPDLLSCDVIVDGVVTSIPVHERIPAVTWPTARHVGVQAYGLDFRVDWLALYTAPAR